MKHLLSILILLLTLSAEAGTVSANLTNIFAGGQPGSIWFLPRSNVVYTVNNGLVFPVTASTNLISGRLSPLELITGPYTVKLKTGTTFLPMSFDIEMPDDSSDHDLTTLSTNLVTYLYTNLPNLFWTNLDGTPTTLAGYGITDAAPLNSPSFTGTMIISNSVDHTSIPVSMEGGALSLGGSVRVGYLASDSDIDADGTVSGFVGAFASIALNGFSLETLLDEKGVGSVTSVGLSLPGVIFNASVPGSPITSSGTLAPTLATQTANTVLAGPTTGSAATPTFRALVANDIPSLSSTYQPLAAALTSWAAVTRASGFDTFAATPSSANLASLVTDETGSGALVMANGPTFTNQVVILGSGATTTGSYLRTGTLTPVSAGVTWVGYFSGIGTYNRLAIDGSNPAVELIENGTRKWLFGSTAGTFQIYDITGSGVALDFSPGVGDARFYRKVKVDGTLTAGATGTAITRIRHGTATLSGGTVTVSDTTVTTSSLIFLTAQSNSSVGALRISARVAGTSFTITSSNGADSGVVAYELIEP